MAEFFKNYPAVASALVGLVGIAIGFIGNGLINRAKRQHELEDRDFNRRAEIWDARINEAREYIDTWNLVVHMHQKVYRVLKGGDSGDLTLLIQDVKEHYSNLPLLLDEGARKRASITILDDDELINLLNRLLSDLSPSMIKFLEIQNILDQSTTAEIKKGDLAELLDVLREADKLITKMKIRLDKLAEKVPQK